jgi:hypothetical protein
MNRDKQIEEMVKDVTRSICWCNEEIPTVDGMGTAITLYEKGYRKASDVAEEIFAEINELKKQYLSGDINGNELYVQLYLLEKEYTEEGK